MPLNDGQKDDYAKLEDTRSDLLEDSRKYLGHLFDRADEYQRDSKSQLNKLFPTRHEGVERQGGGPFLNKLAAQHTYRFAMQHTPLVKNASANFQQVMFFAFQDELDKIAALGGPMAKGMGAMASRVKASPAPMARVQQQAKIRQQMPQKVWDVSDMARRMGVTG